MQTHETQKGNLVMAVLLEYCSEEGRVLAFRGLVRDVEKCRD